MSTKPSIEITANCDDILELVPDYAFGLTDRDEARLVEANLSYCPEAQTLLDEYRVLQDEMRTAVPQVEPSPLLGQRLMAVAAAPEHPAAPPQRRLRWRTAWVLAAAAVLALVATNVYWLARVGSLEQDYDSLAGASESTSFVLNNTDNLHWVRLASDTQQTTSAFMMWNTGSWTGLIYARGFAALPTGYRYHLWLTRGDERVFAGIIQIDGKGNGALIFHITQPIDNFTWARITIESQATTTTPQPTGTPVVAGQLDA